MKVQTRRIPRILPLIAFLAWVCPLSLAAPAAARKQPAATVEIGELGSQIQVLLHVGDTLRVILPANPSTGYGWQIAADNTALLKPSASRKFAAPAARPGAPGKQSFSFIAAAPGKDQLLLNYRRPWEKNAKPARTYTVGVTIKSAAAANAAAPTIIPVGVRLATYGGKLPCADCTAIRTSIVLYAEAPQQLTHTYYVRTMSYLGAPKGDVISIDAGHWSMKKGVPADPNAIVYSLQPNGTGNAEKYQLKSNTLIPLDNDDRPIQSPFNMDLHKLP